MTQKRDRSPGGSGGAADCNAERQSSLYSPTRRRNPAVEGWKWIDDCESKKLALLKRLSNQDDRNGKGPEDDRAFFEKFPDRSYRARLATTNEVAILEGLGDLPSIPDSMFWWAAVWQI